MMQRTVTPQQAFDSSFVTATRHTDRGGTP
jgi:hypothetical protein